MTITPNPSLEQALKAKARAETQIRAALSGFLDETGLTISGIDFRLLETTRLNGDKRSVITELTLEVKL